MYKTGVDEKGQQMQGSRDLAQGRKLSGLDFGKPQEYMAAMLRPPNKLRQTEIFIGDPRFSGQLRAEGGRLGHSVPGTGQGFCSFGSQELSTWALS